MIYETSLIPGEGIGNIKLGDTLYNVIKHLDKYNYKLRISYSNSQYLETPIVVTATEFGIRLTFSNKKQQTLELIEFLDVDSPSHSSGTLTSRHSRLLKLIYNGVSLNEFESVSTNNSETASSYSSAASSNSTFHALLSNGPTFKAIYNKIFGPTYPGKLNQDCNTYILSYPGISFKFTIANDQLLESLKNKDDDLILSTLLNWDAASDVRCLSIALYKGNSWSEFEKEFVKVKENSGSVETSTLKSVVKDEISSVNANLKDGIISISFKGSDKTPATIVIGKTTQQEVLNILGPPDDYFNKFDSRLLIHKHLSELLSSNENDMSHYKFHNYFRYGIDILYDLNTSRSSRNQHASSTTVKKFIIHNGGITESLDFMKWNRCNWEITAGSETGSDIKFNSEMYFHQLPEELRKLTPVLLNRIESEFIDNDLDIIEFPNESTRAKTKSDSQLERKEDEKVKTWGQSKLYGYGRCILEVINSNGCIVAVTIY
ncbi:hypothetical protein PICST_86494 [Scheffersomyces stipitis CBS 6054]|uniref:Uncharacterized protein n=1 Tax=Scheffersomyces stipitis (strain ATCC 58785 / CBS 6054 / NBRC 10063 / NRRL Y-11545) TaxID=322104 RepID=A3GF31_PICST|nr:predicted protein [Scheffersomyces stipitis CBS 6054]EAZ63685.2 hypothetical protein PICST_86494 [Scheffersomyces stipitis CBS 6054]